MCAVSSAVCLADPETFQRLPSQGTWGSEIHNEVQEQSPGRGSGNEFPLFPEAEAKYLIYCTDVNVNIDSVSVLTFRMEHFTRHHESWGIDTKPKTATE